MTIELYADLNEILKEDATFVFDNGVFNLFRGTRAPLGRLKTVRRISSRDEREQEIDAICSDIEAEAEYVEFLTKEISERDNILTTRGICFELNDYYKVLTNFKEKTEGKAGGFLQDLELAICEAVSTCLINAVPRAKEVIARNKSNFRDYRAWFDLLAESERDSETEENVDRTNDNNLISLSLVGAWEKPTILLSTDYMHVGNSLRVMYGYHQLYGNSQGLRNLLPEIPPKHYRAFIGVPDMWKLRVDSEDPKIKKLEKLQDGGR